MKRKFTEEEMKQKKFGKLKPLNTYIKPHKKGGHYARRVWICQCDCGNIVERDQWYLISEKGKNSLCGQGCKLRVWGGPSHPRWKGYGEVSANFLNLIKHHARTRGLEVNITLEDIWKMYLQQEKKCKLSGLPIQFAGQKQIKRDIKDCTASLDRIDSSKGYTKDNVQLVHKDINTIKINFEEGYFVYLCKQVAKTCKDYQEVRERLTR